MPAGWTRLFGTEHSATRLLALVRTDRLVTVVGPGGCGKTRLAIEVARALRDASDGLPDGNVAGPRFLRLTFVSLVDCQDEQQAVDMLARALNIAARDPLQQIRATLEGQPTLLVLDNFEQLVGSASGMLVTLLDGEQAFTLGGLPVPEVDARPEDAARNPAVALFVDRAHGAKDDYRLSPRELSAVCALVHLLDGMPLALELAASRMRGGSAADLVQRLQADAGTPLLDLLARPGGVASGGQRHASLRVVMAWSWRQLPAAQAALLQAMTVLGSAARVETVAAVAGIDRERAQALLQDLFDASLVQSRDDSSGVMRHALLQPVREFAAESMALEQAALARSRLRRWLTEHGPLLLRAGLLAFEPELAHVFGAIINATADAALEEAARLAVALKRYWSIDTLESMPVSVMQTLEAAAHRTIDPALRSELLELLAHARGVAGFVREASQLADEALACATDARQRSLALTRRVWLLVLAGQHGPEAVRMLDSALQLGHDCGDAVAEAVALRLQMMIAVNVRLDFAGSEPQVMRAQALWESLGDLRNARRRLLDRATCWAWSGRNEEAAAALSACEQDARADHDAQTSAMCAWQLGRVQVRLRAWPEAAASFRRCLRLGWERNHMLIQSYALLHMADALVMTGQADSAARLQGFAIPSWQQHFGPINRIETRELRRTRRLLRLALGGPRAETLRLSGRGLSLPEAVALALAST